MWPSLQEIYTYFDIDSASLTAREVDIYTFEREVVIDAIEAYCQRSFDEQSYTETFFLKNIYNNIQVTNYPLTTVTSIVNSDSETIESAKYIIDPIGEITHVAASRITYWPKDKYTITYTAGFTSATAPKMLISVFYDLIGYRSELRKSNTTSDMQNVKKASVAGVGTVEFQDASMQKASQNWYEYLNTHQDVLNNYVSDRALGVSFND